MGGRALVQWEQNRDNAPEALHVDLYAGGPAPGTGLEDVTFYQVPYAPSTQGVDERLDIIARMPELRVLQLVSAGYEQVPGSSRTTSPCATAGACTTPAPPITRSPSSSPRSATCPGGRSTSANTAGVRSRSAPWPTAG